MATIGVDGCSSGWFAVALTRDGRIEHGIYESLAELSGIHSSPTDVLLDIPIGLPESDVRECDQMAREMLGCRGSSVFYTPCRDAVKAETHDEAKRVNEDSLGRSVSVQAWNICDRIEDVDDFVRANEGYPVVESHPEMCFFGLNDGSPLAYSKATEKGRDVRLAILEREHEEARDVYESALEEYDRQEVARDDVLDAIALAVAGTEERSTIPADPPRDGEALPMRIEYPGPSYEAWQRTNLPPNG